LYRACGELPFTSFEQALDAVTLGFADVAVIPVDNSAAGRVADVHHLLPTSGLFVVDEYFLPIRFDLMALPGTSLGEVEFVRSHVHALGQCRKVLREGGWRTLVSDDTAGAAREVAELGDPRHAALAPPAAAELSGLEVLRPGVEDDPENTTRFVVLSREAAAPSTTGVPMMTSLFFCVRNIPSALYKALGGFAGKGSTSPRSRATTWEPG
jgi:prephenate dehydratase